MEDPQFASLPSFPEWLARVTETTTARQRRLNLRETQTALKLRLRGEGDSKTYSETGQWGDGNVPLDSEGQFLDDDGNPLTQEQIDNEELEILQCQYCQEHEEECDDDDTCENCVKNNVDCYRPEDPDRQEREQCLGKGIDGLKATLNAPRQIPVDVWNLVQSCTPIFRRAWKEGRNEESYQEVKKINGIIWQLPGGRPFTVPALAILERIFLIRDTIAVLARDPDNLAVRSNTSADCTIYALSLGTALGNCGLDWKMIVHEDVMMILQALIEDQYNKAPEARELLNLFLRSEQRATPTQVTALATVGKHIDGIFVNAGSRKLKAAHAHLEQIELVNESLKNANRQLGFREKDHELPMRMFYNLVSRETTDLGRDERMVHITQLKLYTVLHLLEGGFQKLGEELQKSLKVDTAVALPPMFQSLLEQSKRSWRLPIEASSEKNNQNNQNGGERMDTDQEETSSPNGRTPDTPGDTPPESQGAGRPDTPKTSPTTQNFTEQQGPPKFNGIPQSGPKPQSHTSQQGPPKFNDIPQSGPKPQTFTSQQGPPKFDGIPGPFYSNGVTDLGKVEAVRPNGKEKRVFLNVGSDKCAIYDCIPGNDLGRGAAEDLYNQKQFKADPSDIKMRKPDHVKRVLAFVEIPQRITSMRTPISYFQVLYHDDKERNPLAEVLPLKEWTTRTNLIWLLGKRHVDGPSGYRATLTVVQTRKKTWLEKCISQNLHPDTGRPITDDQKLQLPWLFSPFPFMEANAPFDKQNTRNNKAPDVGVGDGWMAPI